MTDRDTPTDRNSDGTASGSTPVDAGGGDRYRPQLGDLSHTHPRTDERFGETQAYVRGPAVAADGGARADRRTDPERESAAVDATDGSGDAPDADDLGDVDHENGADAQDAYERGRDHSHGGEDA